MNYVYYVHDTVIDYAPMSWMFTFPTLLNRDFLSTYPPVSVLFALAPFSTKPLRCLGGGTSRSFHNFHALEHDYDVLTAYDAILQELDAIKLDDASFPVFFLVNEAKRYFIMMIRTKHIEECGLTELSDTAKINNCFTTPVLTSSIALYHIYGRDTAFRIELQFSGKEALNTGSS